MTQENNCKKHRRPLRTAAAVAAAAAMLTIGVSAANPQGVQELLYTIRTAVLVDDTRLDLTFKEGGTVAVLDLSQVGVENRAGRAILIAGEEEIDITQDLEQEGQYVYSRPSGDGTLNIVVTGTPEEHEFSVSLDTPGREDGVTYSFHAVDTDTANEILKNSGIDVDANSAASTSADPEVK